MRKAIIIVPCFNEAKRLSVAPFKAFCESEAGVDFLFVNDGSTDSTLDIINGFKEQIPGRVYVMVLGLNCGKAEAVRRGILDAGSHGQYQYFGFWDADLATPLNEIPLMLEVAIQDFKDLVIGSRWKRLGARVERKALRHYLGRLFATLASTILHLPVYDTQCGAKIFKASLAELFEEKFITRWLFDIELLARYRNKFGLEKALSNILEWPVREWKEKGGSKLGFADQIKTPFAMWAIYRKYNG